MTFITLMRPVSRAGEDLSQCILESWQVFNNLAPSRRPAIANSKVDSKSSNYHKGEEIRAWIQLSALDIEL